MGKGGGTSWVWTHLAAQRPEDQASLSPLARDAACPGVTERVVETTRLVVTGERGRSYREHGSTP